MMLGMVFYIGSTAPQSLIAKEKRWVAPDRFSSRLNRRDSVYPLHPSHAFRKPHEAQPTTDGAG